MILFSIFCDFQQILEVLKSTFLELVLFMHMYWDTIAKIKKTSNFFDNFWYQRKWFEKITCRGDQKLIVLNPFLDSLWHLGFKNGGLHPGGDIECFPGPQDVVVDVKHSREKLKNLFVRKPGRKSYSLCPEGLENIQYRLLSADPHFWNPNVIRNPKMGTNHS